MPTKTTTPEQARQFHMALTGRPECFEDCCFCKLKAERDALSKKYYELLYSVEIKHPNETRHETALRYIREAERHDCNDALEAEQIEGGE